MRRLAVKKVSGTFFGHHVRHDPSQKRKEVPDTFS